MLSSLTIAFVGRSSYLHRTSFDRRGLHAHKANLASFFILPALNFHISFSCRGIKDFVKYRCDPNVEPPRLLELGSYIFKRENKIDS